MDSLTGLFCSQKSFTLQSRVTRGHAIHGGACVSSQTIPGGKDYPLLCTSGHVNTMSKTLPCPWAHMHSVLALYSKRLVGIGEAKLACTTRPHVGQLRDPAWGLSLLCALRGLGYWSTQRPNLAKTTPHL